MRKNDCSEWAKLFELPQTEYVEIFRAFAYLSDGVQRYAAGEKCRAFKLSERISEGDTGEIVLLLEGSTPVAAPGDRICYRKKYYGIKSIREHQDLEGRVIARKCTI